MKTLLYTLVVLAALQACGGDNTALDTTPTATTRMDVPINPLPLNERN
jgi:hypothetical protein